MCPPATTATTVPPPNLTLAVQPADRYGSVYQMIGDSRHSLDITMYELADPQVVSLLTAARRRGVAVRVLLDRAGSGACVNQAAFDQLSAEGSAGALGADHGAFHQKTLTADRRCSAILTGDLTRRLLPDHP